MSTFPGLNDPFLALTLAAIHPGLKGVIIGGPTGTGKTTIARAARTLFPPGAPFVNVPLNCTMDRLVGGVDIEQSGKEGKIIATKGLLAQAHKGVLYIDEINLLPETMVSIIMQALNDGSVKTEREGVSESFPSQFTLIGTFNPEEGLLTRSVTDRVASVVFSKTINHLGWRMMVASRASKKLVVPEDMIERVAQARKTLPHVTISDEQLTDLVKFSTMMGIEGNRPDLFAVRCAMANAALHLRWPVTQSDLDLAKRLVYMSRVGEQPLPGDSDYDSDHLSDKSTRKKEKKTGNGPSSNENPGNEKNKKGEEGNKSDHEGEKGRWAPGQDFQPDEDDGFEQFQLPEIKGKGDRSKTGGKRQNTLNNQRGRHVRSVSGQGLSGRIDLFATLKSAAIFGAITVNEERTANTLNVRKEDVHIKQFHRKSGLLFIFAVDGSGSMAINHFEAARGAALSLLEKAYVYRDRVAMIYFRNKEARVLIKPGTSVTGAARALRKIKAGGKTPMTGALLKTLDLAVKARANRESPGSVLVLFTDGKANQPHNEIEGQPPETTARNELLPLCDIIKKEMSACLLFDTRMGKMENPYGTELAQRLGAHYIRLRKAAANEVAGRVQKETQGLR